MSTHSPELILDDDREEVAGPNEEEPIRSTSDHVLVIDDEPDMLGLYKACLSSHGYRVTAASDGPAGLDLAVVDPPTLVILDMLFDAKYADVVTLEKALAYLNRFGKI